MTLRSLLARTTVAVSLAAITSAALAAPPVPHVVPTGHPAGALYASDGTTMYVREESDRSSAAPASDGQFIGTVNGLPFSTGEAAAGERVFPLDGKVYFSLGAPASSREIGVGIGAITFSRGAFEQPTPSGTYDLTPQSPVPDGMLYSSYIEKTVSDVPGFEKFWVFRPKTGYLNLNFNADRSRVEGTFEGEYTHSEGGVRAFKNGIFSSPNVDLERP